MKQLFVLFVTLHLVIDLAMPSLLGAFRFNPDESVVGIRVQPVHAQDLQLAPRVDRLLGSFELPRLEMKTPVDPKKDVNAPDLIVLLPRRDLSSDRPLQRLTEDH